MYTVVGFPRTRAMRVIWLLEELGQAYELTPALPQSEEARAVNPTGKVPVLLEDGAAITDSVAICTYLADKHGGCTFPSGTLDRARQDSITQFAVDVLEGALWTAAKNTFILPEDLRLPAIKDVCRYEFGKGLDTLAQWLGEGPYVMGEAFTIADIILGHCSGWAVVAKFDLPKDGPVHAYFKRLRDRPAYQATKAKIDAVQ